MKSHYLNGI